VKKSRSKGIYMLEEVVVVYQDHLPQKSIIEFTDGRE
jgi:hypothetical protein